MFFLFKSGNSKFWFPQQLKLGHIYYSLGIYCQRQQSTVHEGAELPALGGQRNFEIVAGHRNSHAELYVSI